MVVIRAKVKDKNLEESVSKITLPGADWITAGDLSWPLEIALQKLYDPYENEYVEDVEIPSETKTIKVEFEIEYSEES